MQKELLVTADAQTLAFEVDCHLFQGSCGFPAPSAWSFIFDPIFTIGPVEFNKPMLLAIIGTFAILALFWAGFSKPKVIPGKLQMIAEALYDFVHRGIAKEIIGKKGEPFVPLLVSLFFFVWMLNLWAIIPIAQFPVSSLIAYPVGLALLVWAVYMTVTFRNNGFVGGIRNLCVPSGLPKPIYVILTPIEFVSNIFVRPLHAGGPTLREHVRRPHPDPGLHDRDLVHARHRARHRLRHRVVRRDPGPDRLRDVHPGAPGLRVHRADRHVLVPGARRSALRTPGPPPGHPLDVRWTQSPPANQEKESQINV